MTDSKNEIRVFSGGWMSRLKLVCEYVERNLMGITSGRHKRTPITDDATDPVDGAGGVGGGGGCCCAEGHAIHVAGVADDAVVPDFYYFPDPNFCGCAKPDDAGSDVKLYLTDDGYKSAHTSGDDEDNPDAPLCTYPDCTAGASWTWNGSGWDLVEGSRTGAGCGEAPSPDYDGVTIGDSADTTLSPTPAEGVWELAVDGSTLTYSIGGAVIVSYAIDPSSPRGFCATSTNTYRISSCDRVRCGGLPPAFICLTPGMNEQTIQCTGWSEEVQLPGVLIANFEGHDCSCAFPPSDIALGLVGEDQLRSGEFAAWQSGTFTWHDTGEDDPDDDCHQAYSHGLINVVWPVSVRFALTGVGGCGGSTITIQVHVGPGFCDPNGIVEIGGPGPGIINPEDVANLAATLDFASITTASCGPEGPPETIPFCNWIKAPSMTWEGGFHTFPTYPDHYVTVNIAAPPPE